MEGSIEGFSRFVGYNGIFSLGCTLRRNGREDRVLEVQTDDVPFLCGAHLNLPNPHIYADISHLAECVLENREPLANGCQMRHTVEILETALAQTDGGAPLRSTF